MAQKKRKTAPKKKVTPKAEDHFKFFNREVGKRFHDSLVTREFVIERGFHKPNAHFILII